MTKILSVLILDFGGVLTSDFWAALGGFCRREGLADHAVRDLVTKDPHGRSLLIEAERGAIDQADFERRIAALLGLRPEGLLERMAADLRPDERMLAAVESLRAGGVRVAVLTNSWGSGHFDVYAPWQLADRADIVVVSDQVGMRKPETGIYELLLERLGVEAHSCVFVDDVAAYLEPARALGMSVIHHTDTDATLEALQRLFRRAEVGRR